VHDALLGGEHDFAVDRAVAERLAADRDAGLERARQHGAQIVTSEMVLFEWLRDASHPRFRDVQKILK
jgi:hypothetical protein